MLDFGQKICDVARPEDVVDRIVDTVAQYKPDSDESGIWKQIRIQLDSALLSLSGPRVI